MSDFKRSVTLLDAVMLVAGSMIGSGIFIVSAGMLRGLGSPAWMLVAWIVAGVLTVLAALSYGELAGMMPKAGGQYVYIQRAFGKLPSFMYGWTVFTVINSGIVAAVAVAFAKFSAVFFPALSPENILLDLGIVQVSASQVLNGRNHNRFSLTSLHIQYFNRALVTAPCHITWIIWIKR